MIELRPPRLGATTLIAVDGPSGSGKTHYANELARELGATVVSTDDFATWDAPVSWWPRLVNDVLIPIEMGKTACYQRIEWTDGRSHPGRYRRIEVPEVLVIEGVSAGRRSIYDKLSHLVWCELPDETIRLERAVARDGEEVRKHMLTWQDFERGWFAVDQTKARADLCR
ncbi:MAG: AAA family ATPase [Actinophytocola sp.]|uniref:uridine kinase family protein n=1 Tax=Actinophytocola sp. TaxID=1872138 RepID=UPI003C77AC89